MRGIAAYNFLVFIVGYIIRANRNLLLAHEKVQGFFDLEKEYLLLIWLYWFTLVLGSGVIGVWLCGEC